GLGGAFYNMFQNFLATFGLASNNINTLPSAPGAPITFLLLVLIAAIAWIMIYSTHKLLHLGHLRKVLTELEKKHAEILQEADQEAWRGALANAHDKLDQLAEQRVKP